jgi:NADH dehydrogenase
LERFGVKVMTDQRVTSISKEGVTIGETFIASENVFWAAGNQASPVLKTLNIPLDRQGRVIVEEDLSIAGHPNIFVLGDACCAMDPKTKAPLPALASVAIQQGRYAAEQVRSLRDKKNRRPFRYFDKGTMATIGKTKAIGVFWGIKFSGLFAWLAWCFVHILYLIGFRNRISVLTQWLFSHFSNQRGARLINRSIDEELPPTRKS